MVGRHCTAVQRIVVAVASIVRCGSTYGSMTDCQHARGLIPCPTVRCRHIVCIYGTVYMFMLIAWLLGLFVASNWFKVDVLNYKVLAPDAARSL